MSRRNKTKNMRGKKNKRMLIGFALSALIVTAIVGCGNGDDDSDDNQTEYVSIENPIETNVGGNEESGEGDFFIIMEIIEEEDFTMAIKVPANEAGDVLDASAMHFIDLYDGISIEIEEGSNSRVGTVEDILEGDLIRVYAIEGQGFHMIDRMVIIR